LNAQVTSRDWWMKGGMGQEKLKIQEKLLNFSTFKFKKN
jgi:hypothetical protein